jgi:hypothetical protein
MTTVYHGIPIMAYVMFDGVLSFVVVVVAGPPRLQSPLSWTAL